MPDELPTTIAAPLNRARVDPGNASGGATGDDDAPTSDAHRDLPAWQWILVVLILLAARWVYNATPDRYHVFNDHPWVMVAAGAAMLVGPLRRAVVPRLDRWRHPSDRTALLTAGGISAASFIFLYGCARLRGQECILYFHDEHSFMLQLRALCHGRLWMPPIPRPLRDFVESFNMMVYPKYGSIYFPGTALLYAPFPRIGLPWWTAPMTITSLSIGGVYLLFRHLIDGVAGLLAVLLALACAQLRWESHMMLSQPAQIFFQVLILLVYLRWRRDRCPGWATLLGVLCGWAGIVRPADALCVVVPVGLAMLLDLRRETRSRWIATSLVVLAGAVPFLALQAWQNFAMTGRVTEFASDAYVKETYPAPMVGFHEIDWSHTPHPWLLDKQLERANFIDPAYARHTTGQIWPEWRDRRLHLTMLAITSQLTLLVLAPIGLFGIDSRPRLVFFAMAPLFLLFYSTYVFYFVHYAVVLAPAVILLTLLGAETLVRAAPAHDRREFAGSVAVVIAAGAIAAFPQFNPMQQEGYLTPELTPAEHALAALPGDERAVVLFRTAPDSDTGQDPVYNVDAAWPEDERIMRCRDLGPRNGELYQFLARRRQGDRVVYRYDRGRNTITRLGDIHRLSQASNSIGAGNQR